MSEVPALDAVKDNLLTRPAPTEGAEPAPECLPPAGAIQTSSCRPLPQKPPGTPRTSVPGKLGRPPPVGRQNLAAQPGARDPSGGDPDLLLQALARKSPRAHPEPQCQASPPPVSYTHLTLPTIYSV